MKTLALVLAATALAGCASAPPFDVQTPFGSVNVEDEPRPDPVGRRQERSQVNAISLEDLTRRENLTDNCVLRHLYVEKNPCRCYEVFETVPSWECREKSMGDAPTGDAGAEGAGPSRRAQVATSPTLPALQEAISLAADSIRENEGGPLLTVTDGHFCYGVSVQWHADVDTSALTKASCDALLVTHLKRISVQVGGIVGRILPVQQHAVVMEVVYWKGRSGVLDLLPNFREQAESSDWKALARDMRVAAESLPDGQRERMNRLSIVLEQ